MQYWVGRGVTRFRVPIGWGQQVNGATVGCQLTQFGPLDPGYISQLDTVLANAVTAGAKCLIDLHAFGFSTPLGFAGNQLGGSGSPVEAFADVIGKLAARYASNDGLYGLDIMNEWAGDMDSSIVFTCNQQAITSARVNGYIGPIYIEGTNYSGAWNWVTNPSGVNNNANLYQLFDPRNNLIFSAHCYLDRDSSGTHFSWANEIAAAGSSPTGTNTNANIFSQRLASWIAWLNQHGLRGHIGEMGWSSDSPVYGGSYDWADWNTAGQNAIQLCHDNNIEITPWSAGFEAGFDFYGYAPDPFDAATASTADYTSAGVQAAQMVVYDHFTGYSGPQPTAYLLRPPTDYINPTTDSGGQIHYTPIKNLYATSGSASENFTIYYGGKITSPVTITPHAKLMDGTSAGGTFTPSTVTLAAGNNALATFTYTPASSATFRISTTNSAGWTDPPEIGLSSRTDDFYRSITPTLPSNVYALYLKYTPYIGPAIRLQRGDGTQQDWSFNNVGNLDRAAIQTWANTRTGIRVVKEYDQSPSANHKVYVGDGGQWPMLTLANGTGTGYPTIVVPKGTRGNFTVPFAGQVNLSILARFSQDPAANSGLFRTDHFTGPVTWSNAGVAITRTGWVGGPPNLTSATTLTTTSLNITNSAYGDYGFVYAANSSVGNRTYKNGSPTANNTSIMASFTGTGSGTSLTVTSVTGSIQPTDGVFGTGVPAGTYIISQTSGTAGGAGVYVTSQPTTSSGAALTSSYILNPAFGDGSTTFAWFVFAGNAQWAGEYQNLEFIPALALSDSQMVSWAGFDATYYSTPLPDVLPAVNPTISGMNAAQAIYPGRYDQLYPFKYCTVADGNGGAADTVTITLTGSGGTLSGTGLSGTGPYTLASDTPANITTNLNNLFFVPSSTTVGATTTFTVLVNSNAGTSATDSTTTMVVTTWVDETPFSAPVGTFTPLATTAQFKGTNFAGLENDRFNNTPVQPKSFEWDYFQSKGFGTIRLPISSVNIWDGFDHTLNATSIGFIKTQADFAFARNMWVIIDIHNQGQIADTRFSPTGGYHVLPITPNTVASDIFRDNWRKLAKKFVNYPNVIFELMNEPASTGGTAAQWVASSQLAINEIRTGAGATQKILVSGIGFSTASAFTTNGSAAAWHGFTGDPLNNFFFSMHQYLDDGSGTQALASANGSTILNSDSATTWLLAEGFKAMLTEFGFAPDPWKGSSLLNLQWNSGGSSFTSNGITQGTNLLNYMSANANPWVGWTVWGSGDFPTMPSTNGYGFNVEAQNSPGGGLVIPLVEQPQMAVLVTNL